MSIEQLIGFVDFEKKQTPNKTHIAEWALAEIYKHADAAATLRLEVRKLINPQPDGQPAPEDEDLPRALADRVLSDVREIGRLRALVADLTKNANEVTAARQYLKERDRQLTRIAELEAQNKQLKFRLDNYVNTDVEQDAARYRILRRGQHWSIINGIGDELRGDPLDAAIDTAIDAAIAAQTGGAA